MNKRKTHESVQKLYKAFLTLKSEDECRSFLRDLMTEQEIETFASRLYAAEHLLKEDMSYREISKETGISTTTITRINHWLENGMGAYEMVLKRISSAKGAHIR